MLSWLVSLNMSEQDLSASLLCGGIQSFSELSRQQRTPVSECLSAQSPSAARSVRLPNTWFASGVEF